ncbi:MAG: ribose-phosphate pyrophosphokinase [Alphaproteobacteria bacterium]|nr:ribose-phosphate pyrophosphokinase [Alphaproteobacteria bacterium]
MKILTCNSNKPLAEEICKNLNIQLVMASVRSFADKEIFLEIQENVRGEDVFVIQSTSYPANDHLMELLIAIDALKRGSAKRITAVLPYYGYARQDRKTGPRTPISAKLVANMLTIAGAHRVLTLDLHSAQIQGFFDVPTDNLIATPVMVRDIRTRYQNKKFVIVSPDVGGVVRARTYAGRLDTDLAIIDKRRERAGISEVMNIIGDIQDKHCILVDDIIDSGGTICNAANALLQKGALSVSAYVTHGVLSGNAGELIQNSPLEKIVITNSIQLTEKQKSYPKIEQLSIAQLLGEAIYRISHEQSVSSLFD